jgi:integral membrane protein (TIGR01906 family)
LLNGEEVTYLSDLRYPDGTSIFNIRELQHLRDVKAVTQIAYIAVLFSSILAVLAAYRLSRNRSTIRELRTGLLNGSILTLGIVVTIVVAAVVNWDFFFTSFHSLLFQTGTWRFAYSDMLIRLFPEQFWFDAALTIGALSTVCALVIMYIMRRSKTAQLV